VKARCLSINESLRVDVAAAAARERNAAQAGRQVAYCSIRQTVFSQRKMDLLSLPIRWLSLREALLFRITWPAPAIRFGAVLAM
jgi:hypothetical protein